jgi:hypothetical protein
LIIFRLKHAITYLVAFAMLSFSVLTAIQFNNKPRRMLYKIEDVASEWGLTAEVEANGLELAQSVPKFTLGIGRVRSERPRAGNSPRLEALPHTPHP